MKIKKIKTLPTPHSLTCLHLPHLPHTSISLICHLPHLSSPSPSHLTPHASRLHHSLSHKASITPSHTHQPPSVDIYHQPPHFGLYMPASMATPHVGLHIYSIYPTTHTYSLSRLTASTPNESASAATSTCRPPHAVLLTRVDLFILTVIFSLFNFLITLSLFCILGFV